MNYKQKYFKHHGLYECDVIYCKICGKRAVNLHHIIYRSQGGTDDPSNLIPLCYQHHEGHHNRNNPTTKQLINANNIK
jgi:5-methylcytosine-specific restriction endonuclease McrA